MGITFVAASGDSGPAGGAVGRRPPRSVLAVGGTTLNVSFHDHYEFETAWFDSSGGYSQFQAEPGFQRSVQATGKRSTPDVAFDGDPATGVQVFDNSPFTGQGEWDSVGGTSLGAPAWAAIIAIADEGRALEGKGSLDGPTQTLPALTRSPRPVPRHSPVAAPIGRRQHLDRPRKSQRRIARPCSGPIHRRRAAHHQPLRRRYGLPIDAGRKSSSSRPPSRKPFRSSWSLAESVPPASYPKSISPVHGGPAGPSAEMP